jgi:hypothetical protein
LTRNYKPQGGEGHRERGGDGDGVDDKEVEEQVQKALEMVVISRIFNVKGL